MPKKAKNIYTNLHYVGSETFNGEERLVPMPNVKVAV
jgi:hypothetical protein